MDVGFCTKQILTQFSLLEEVFIDTSSLIYMEKCSFLIPLSEVITLRIVPAVQMEYGPDRLPCTIYKPVSATGSTDIILYTACKETGLPLISEDKKLLKRITHIGLPCFNSLMMLNFLFYKQVISNDQFVRYHNKLNTIARYHSAIWDAGAAVTQALIMKQSG